jgi:zinc transport system substrate-binding protein
VRVDLVPEIVPDAIESLLEPAVGKRLDLAAVVAQQVVVVLAARKERLVARGVGELQALNELEARELVERPVHARQADLAVLGAQGLEDLVRAQAAVLPREQRNHEQPGPPGTAARVGQGRGRVGLPGKHQAVLYPLLIVRLVIIFVSTLAFVAGCGDDGTAADGRVTVAAAFYPLAYAAEQIGGDQVAVRNLTPPGAEPHDVELSARDVERIRAADVVLYLGSGFQPNFERAVDGAKGKKVDLLRGLTLISGDEGVDPHVWLDPLRYATQARHIGDALDRPGQANRFAARLGKLNADFERGLAHCARKEIVTSHAAFGYLADRYGLEQIALTGITPEAEPTARDLERIVREVERSGATTIFFETLVSPRLAETVARETGAKTAVLNPLEGLSQKELDVGQDYFSVMRENLATLRQALGCR